MDIDKHLLSERDICSKFITPALKQAGWQQHQFREEVNLTDGRAMVRGRRGRLSLNAWLTSWQYWMRQVDVKSATR